MKVTKRRSYDVARRESYPPLQEQVGAIVKTLAALQEQGVALPPEGQQLVAQVQAVKDMYPKASG